jgi:protein SCO1/2
MLALSAASSAGVAPAQLDTVKVDAQAGAAFPMSLRFADVKGVERSLADVVGDNPAVVVFADYTCSNLCGPILAFAAAGLARTGLAPGRDFHLIVIGLDPKDGPREAIDMKKSRIGDDTQLANASVFLVGNAPALKAATQNAGYHYIYDKEHDQFAHPAAAYVINRDGMIVRVLSGLNLTGDSLRLALVDAGRGRVGTLLDQITLYCFGFDPARGIYTASITKILTIAGCATILILAGGILFMALARRGRAAA